MGFPKQINVKVMGLAGHGKSLIAHIIRKALEQHGIKGSLIDDEAPREDAFIEKLIIENRCDFDVEIETVQLKRDVWADRWRKMAHEDS